MKYIKRFWCFVVGHDMITEYSLNNADVFEGVWRSAWGEHVCMRCDKRHSWQWDR